MSTLTKLRVKLLELSHNFIMSDVLFFQRVRTTPDSMLNSRQVVTVHDWTTVLHKVSYPQLASSDFHFFEPTLVELREQRFSSENEEKEVIRTKLRK